MEVVEHYDRLFGGFETGRLVRRRLSMPPPRSSPAGPQAASRTLQCVGPFRPHEHHAPLSMPAMVLAVPLRRISSWHAPQVFHLVCEAPGQVALWTPYQSSRRPYGGRHVTEVPAEVQTYSRTVLCVPVVAKLMSTCVPTRRHGTNAGMGDEGGWDGIHGRQRAPLDAPARHHVGDTKASSVRCWLLAEGEDLLPCT